MRTPIVESGDFKAIAIAGTRTILVALDCKAKARKGLLGFAFRRREKGKAWKWLRSQKVFESLVAKPDLKNGDYRTNEFPIQSFLWGDYTAEPGSKYEFEIYPFYGSPANPDLRSPLVLSVETETEKGTDHSIFFNRGAIASQAYAREFDNHKPTEGEMNDPDDKHTKWLSRGLLEACLEFIDSTKKTEKLRACVYEFTYAPVIEAFGRAIARGVDVELIVHADKKGANEKAMKKAKLPRKVGGKTIVHPRTKPQIPHNKFIIKLRPNKKHEVWTGSTNMTPSGFLGQSNVGHILHDRAVAEEYLAYWEIIEKDETAKPTKAEVVALSPYPPALPPKDSTTCVFSPRETATMLNWYADRMEDAKGCVLFTAAFTVASDFIEPLAKDRDFLRFVLKEKPPTAEEKKALSADRDLVIAYGAVLGASFAVKDGKIVAKRKASAFPLDRWFLKEELTRSRGNIFFVHTKYLVIDPLSADPLVCTGSANFSENSLTANDENMVLIRGNTRVADIYLTEFDRLFRHFYFRDVANEVAAKAKKGKVPERAFLDEGDASGILRWSDSYFTKDGFKSRRREMFFKPVKKNWTTSAAKRSNKEPIRPKKR